MTYFAHAIGNVDELLLAILLNVRDGEDRDKRVAVGLLLLGRTRQRIVKDRERIDLVKQDVDLVLGSESQERNDQLACERSEHK